MNKHNPCGWAKSSLLYRSFLFLTFMIYIILFVINFIIMHITEPDYIIPFDTRILIA